MVDDDSFLLGCVVDKTSRPSLEGFEAERKRVLSGCKSRAVVDHRFGASEHVTSLKVFHLVVAIRGSLDVARSMVIVYVLFRLAVRYLHVLKWGKSYICVKDLLRWYTCDGVVGLWLSGLCGLGAMKLSGL